MKMNQVFESSLSEVPQSKSIHADVDLSKWVAHNRKAYTRICPPCGLCAMCRAREVFTLCVVLHKCETLQPLSAFGPICRFLCVKND